MLYQHTHNRGGWAENNTQVTPPHGFSNVASVKIQLFFNLNSVLGETENLNLFLESIKLQTESAMLSLGFFFFFFAMLEIKFRK